MMYVDGSVDFDPTSIDDEGTQGTPQERRDVIGDPGGTSH